MHRMDIREEECWRQFENSGRIEDYLSFLSSAKEFSPDGRGQDREDDDAGTYKGDGNHTKAVSGGGVR